MSVEALAVSHEEQNADEAAAALAAAAEKAPTNEAEARAQIAAEEAAKNAPARPEWLDPKFQTPEDMAKAYAELSKKLGAPKEEAAADADANADVDEEALKPEDVEEDADAGKVNLETYDAEYAEKGELSAESYAALEAKGFSKATVDSYIAGQEALAQVATQRITEAAGGKEQMDAMFVWAKTGMTAADIDAFNSTMEKADVNGAVLAMEGLKARYVAANGSDVQLVAGKPAGGAVDTFGSWAEVTRAMDDPRYATDPAYRTKVEQKLSRSNPRAV